MSSGGYFTFELKKQGKLIWILCYLILSSCSLDAKIFNGQPPSPELASQERRAPDFIHGEIVTTYGGKPGYEVKAVFGEISEKSKSLNDNQWEIEGVFYE